MKKRVVILFSAIVLLLTACDPAEQYAISFKANGTTWYSGSAAGYISSGILNINGLSTLQNQNKIIFQLDQYATLDTFDLDSNNVFIYYPASGLPGDGYWTKNRNPAKLIVTEFNPGDKRIVADFYGWIYLLNDMDSILITDGKMDLHYQ